MPLAHVAIAVEGCGWTDPDNIPLMVASTLVGLLGPLSGRRRQPGLHARPEQRRRRPLPLVPVVQHLLQGHRPLGHLLGRRAPVAGGGYPPGRPVPVSGRYWEVKLGSIDSLSARVSLFPVSGRRQCRLKFGSCDSFRLISPAAG